MAQEYVRYMIKIPYADIISKIKEQKGLSESDVDSKIKEKLDKLSGLISREGAAHIVANELGVKLVDNSGKIKDVYPGMRNVDLVGKVTQVFDLRTFARQDGSEGKVANFVIGDETGLIRVVGWGPNADLVKTLSEGSVVKISGGFAKEGLRGFPELHLNDSSKVVIDPAGVSIVAIKSGPSSTRKKIDELKDGDENVEIAGTIVDVYEPRFFEVCPECGFRLKEMEGNKMCDSHGDVKVPDYSYVINMMLDDGSNTMRVVLFKNQAERVFGKPKEEMLSYRENPDGFMAVKDALLGEQFRIIGRVKHNAFFDRTEFVSQFVNKYEPGS